MKTKMIVAAAVLGIACVSGAAQAEVVRRSALSNAAGVCNGSLPSYEGALRKRPTGIANEGASNAFVGCSMTGDQFNGGNREFTAYFVNRTAQPATINCTFVDGVVADMGVFAAQYYPRSIEVGADALSWTIWNPAEGEAYTSFSNINCMLPPGTEINVLGYIYDEEVGVLDP